MKALAVFGLEPMRALAPRSTVAQMSVLEHWGAIKLLMVLQEKFIFAGSEPPICGPVRIHVRDYHQ